MFRAARIVDVETPAQRIEIVLRAWKAPPRDVERVDGACHRQGRTADPRQLGIDESHVEICIVNDQRILADKLQELIRLVGEFRFAAEKLGREAVNLLRPVRHVAFGIEIGMKEFPGRHMVEELDATKLDQTMAILRREAGGFGIENDFAHRLLVSAFSLSVRQNGSCHPHR